MIIEGKHAHRQSYHRQISITESEAAGTYMFIYFYFILLKIYIYIFPICLQIRRGLVGLTRSVTEGTTHGHPALSTVYACLHSLYMPERERSNIYSERSPILIWKGAEQLDDGICGKEYRSRQCFSFFPRRGRQLLTRKWRVVTKSSRPLTNLLPRRKLLPARLSAAIPTLTSYKGGYLIRKEVYSSLYRQNRKEVLFEDHERSIFRSILDYLKVYWNFLVIIVLKNEGITVIRR